MKQLVVFDWNGTLLDDTQAVLYADNTVLRRWGGQAVDFSTFQETVCIPKSEFFIARGCDRAVIINEANKVAALANSTYEAQAKNCKLRNGALELLNWLNKGGVTQTILSNHNIPAIQFQLTRFGLTSYFDKVLANADPAGFLLKISKQERLQQYLSQEATKFDRVVIVGDSTEEIEIAHRLGLAVVSLEGGIHSKERLSKESPTILCQELEQSYAFFQEYFGLTQEFTGTERQDKLVA